MLGLVVLPKLVVMFCLLEEVQVGFSVFCRPGKIKICKTDFSKVHFSFMHQSGTQKTGALDQSARLIKEQLKALFFYFYYLSSICCFHFYNAFLLNVFPMKFSSRQLRECWLNAVWHLLRCRIKNSFHTSR